MSEYGTVETLRDVADLNMLSDVLTKQRARAFDVVVPNAKIAVRTGNLVLDGTEQELLEDGVQTTAGEYKLTPSAEAQLSSITDVPLKYTRRMRASGKLALYDENLNTWLSELDRKLLVRIIRSESEDGPTHGVVRAILSNSYRVVDNLDVLLATLRGIYQSGVDAHVIGADLTPTRMSLKIAAPEVAVWAQKLLEDYRSPFAQDGGPKRAGMGNGWTLDSARAAALREGQNYAPGTEPIIFAGFKVSNSETGHGQASVTPHLTVQPCKNGLTISGDAKATKHLGARMDEGEYRPSDETQRRNLDLISSQTADAVRQFLTESYVETQVRKMEKDAGVTISDIPGTIETVSRSQGFTENEAASILDHFTRGGQMTAGGIMNAVTSFAQTVEDGDRAGELETLALPAMAAAAGFGRR